MPPGVISVVVCQGADPLWSSNKGQQIGGSWPENWISQGLQGKSQNRTTDSKMSKGNSDWQINMKRCPTMLKIKEKQLKTIQQNFYLLA